MGDHGNLNLVEPIPVGRSALRPNRVGPYASSGGPGAAGQEVSSWWESNRVLIVDDDPHALDYVELILSAEGLTTATASTGEEALVLVSRSRPGAVVLDLQLPGLSGHDTLLQLLRDDPALPVIVLTQTRKIEQAPRRQRLCPQALRSEDARSRSALCIDRFHPAV